MLTIAPLSNVYTNGKSSTAQYYYMKNETLQPIPPECKQCKKDCRITFGTASVTAAYYTPIYDKNGVNVNPDMNETSQIAHCNMCDKTWGVKTKGGNTTFTML